MDYSVKDLANKFLSIEKNQECFNIYDEDLIPLWILIRFPIWTLILVNKSKMNQAWDSIYDKTLKVKIPALMNLIKGAIRNNPLQIKNKYDYLFLGDISTNKVSNQFIDIYAYYLIKELGYGKCISIVRTNGIHRVPAFFNNIYFTDYLNLKAYFSHKTSNPNSRILTRIRNILEIFINEFELRINIVVETKKIYRDKIQNFLIYREAFRNILPKISPRVIFELAHYGAKNIACNVVAWELNIPTVELQHGTITNYHIGYNYKNFSPSYNYPALPNYLFLFGSFWKQFCHLPLHSDKKIVTGFPHLETMKQNISSKKHNNAQVLFLSQPAINRELTAFAIELAKLSRNDFPIVYKLHPKEILSDNLYKKMKTLNIRIIDKNDPIDLYSLFNESRYLIGVFSTAIFEGLGFDLKTFIVRLPGFEYLQDLIDSGHVILIDKADEIIDQLNSNQFRLGVTKEQIWNPNALNNMVSAIKKIIK